MSPQQGFGAPAQPQAYAAPPQPQGWGQPGAPPQGFGAQQGIQGPSFGLGVSPGGRLNVSMGGDFSKRALYDAVIGGKGFGKPRVMGLGFVGLSLFFFIVNTLLMVVAHVYFPYFYFLVPPFFWGGLWLLVTGQPARREDGQKAPMWTRAGLGASLLFGIVGGIFMVTVAWEPWL
jgi:hypothetical protein